MPKGKVSAGLLGVRGGTAGLEFFLVHPGGPFFRNKDLGAWSVPKGLITPGEDPLAAAQRELVEETGFALPVGPYVEIGHIVQKGGKRVHAWAVAAPGFEPARLQSNEFELEWPPRSGRVQRFPEVDRGAWLERAEADARINPAQIPFLERASELRGALGL